MAKGLALFITEFGATPSDGGVPPNNRVCEAEANQWWDWMEKDGISGTAWKLVSGVDSSNIFSSSSNPPADGPFPDSVPWADRRELVAQVDQAHPLGALGEQVPWAGSVLRRPRVRLSHANMVEALFLCGPSANESARVTATVL